MIRFKLVALVKNDNDIIKLLEKIKENYMMGAPVHRDKIQKVDYLSYTISTREEPNAKNWKV